MTSFDLPFSNTGIHLFPTHCEYVSYRVTRSFQARLGSMDGIFVAYHNTAKMFGFQYVSLNEMDDRLFGGRVGGERAFKLAFGLMERIVEEAQACFPDQVRITLRSRFLAEMDFGELI